MPRPSRTVSCIDVLLGKRPSSRDASFSSSPADRGPGEPSRGPKDQGLRVGPSGPGRLRSPHPRGGQPRSRRKGIFKLCESCWPARRGTESGWAWALGLQGGGRLGETRRAQGRGSEQRPQSGLVPEGQALHLKSGVGLVGLLRTGERDGFKYRGEEGPVAEVLREDSNSDPWTGPKDGSPTPPPPRQWGQNCREG